MLLFLPTFALWPDLADCTSRMEFRVSPEAAPTTWTYRYDENGDLRWAQMQDGKGFTNVTMDFMYNALGQLQRTRMNPRPDGGTGRTVNFFYDPDGTVLSEIDDQGDGVVEARTWDWFVDGTRVASTGDANVDGLLDTWTVIWTAESEFREVEREEHLGSEGDSEERYLYDSLGRLVETDTDMDGDGVTDRAVWRGYDEAGRILWKEADNDVDGTTDTRAVWNWWCPGR